MSISTVDLCESIVYTTDSQKSIVLSCFVNHFFKIYLSILDRFGYPGPRRFRGNLSGTVWITLRAAASVRVKALFWYTLRWALSMLSVFVYAP